MASRAVRVVDGGELVTPASFRRELGINVGDTVIVEVAGSEVRVLSRTAAIANARRLMRQLLPEGISLADELCADRRTESASE